MYNLHDTPRKKATAMCQKIAIIFALQNLCGSFPSVPPWMRTKLHTHTHRLPMPSVWGHGWPQSRQWNGHVPSSEPATHVSWWYWSFSSSLGSSLPLPTHLPLEATAHWQLQHHRRGSEKRARQDARLLFSVLRERLTERFLTSEGLACFI